MALTADQLADMQADLGISDDQAVFTDAELERLFTRAGEVYESAVYLAWRQIFAQATTYIDYKVAQTEMKRSQVWDHIKAMLAHWKDEAASASGATGALFVGLNGIPTLSTSKDEPEDLVVERRREYHSRYRY